jgi:hypothetical protein
VAPGICVRLENRILATIPLTCLVGRPTENAAKAQELEQEPRRSSVGSTASSEGQKSSVVKTILSSIRKGSTGSVGGDEPAKYRTEEQ